MAFPRPESVPDPGSGMAAEPRSTTGERMIVTRREALAALAAAGLAPEAALAKGARASLSNPAASRAARALYAYLWSIYGRRTLTGQQERPAGQRDEIAYIERVT